MNQNAEMPSAMNAKPAASHGHGLISSVQAVPPSKAEQIMPGPSRLSSDAEQRQCDSGNQPERAAACLLPPHEQDGGDNRDRKHEDPDRQHAKQRQGVEPADEHPRDKPSPCASRLCICLHGMQYAGKASRGT